MNLRASRTYATCGVVAAVLLSFAGVGCGGASTHHSPLAWVGTPQVFVPRDLPRVRIVVGRLRNRSKRTVLIRATALRVRDARGRALKSSGGFTASYAHGLFGAFQQPSALPIRELVRLGRIVILDPGATRPVFVAWRLPPGARLPVSVDYGDGALAVPSVTRPTAP